jgi:hypothetical protein
LETTDQKLLESYIKDTQLDHFTRENKKLQSYFCFVLILQYKEEKNFQNLGATLKFWAPE